MRFLAFNFLIIFGGFSVFALDATITDINSFLDGEREKIEVNFLGYYKGEPSITYGAGWTRISFPGAAYSRELDFVRINDGFVRAIRFFPAVKGSLMEIEYADPQYESSERTDLKIVNGNVELVINTSLSLDEAPPEFSNTPDIPAEASQDSLNPVPVRFPDSASNWSAKALQVTLILVILLALLLVVVKLYRKYLFSNASFSKVFKKNVRILSTHMLGVKQKILVVEINGKKYAIGTTPNSVALIARLGEEDDEPLQQLIRENTESSLTELRMKFLYYRQNKAEETPKIPEERKSFSQELQKRLQKLRPIN